VVPDTAGSVLVCDRCGRRYPVHDGIPVMLVDEAELPATPSLAQAGGTGPGRASAPS
jgi:hypothetical protein